MVIGDREKGIVKQKFEALVSPVRLVMFTQETECQYCYDTRTMVEQLAELSDSVTAEIHNFVTEKDQADGYGITKIPAIAIIGAKDYGVRYYGIPGGYEFGALIDDIVDVSRGDSGLSPASRAELAKLGSDVHLQVFTTPT